MRGQAPTQTEQAGAGKRHRKRKDPKQGDTRAAGNGAHSMLKKRTAADIETCIDGYGNTCAKMGQGKAIRREKNRGEV